MMTRITANVSGKMTVDQRAALSKRTEKTVAGQTDMDEGLPRAEAEQERAEIPVAVGPKTEAASHSGSAALRPAVAAMVTVEAECDVVGEAVAAVQVS